MGVRVRSDLVSSLGRAAHDAGMAGLLGGNLFGRLALHPAVQEIADKRDRGRVVNAAWRRYGTVNSLSVLAVTAGWLGARAGEASPGNLSARERRLARAKDAAVVAVAATGVASAAVGIRFARSAPGGAVPLEDGSTTAPEASAAAARARRALNVLGTANLASELALVGVNSALGQANFRRPPARRLVRRRY
jgi:hypothetical protein